MRGSLRPNASKDIILREWEENILMHLNNVNLVEKDDFKTSYVKFKLYKRDIYGLALVDTGNLVKGTLVSSEFWKNAKARIKIQPKKTKIFQTETEYLGHKVSQGGVQMLEQYVKDIQSWPRPTSCKEMSSYLGFTGYYRGFIPRYSALTNRMNSLKKA